MSDPPPRKVGSLRDRIAAFENKGTSAPASTPPPPRPKPGHVTWQPKPASPTSPRTPASAGTDNDDGERKPAAGVGMSAADAKESIGKLSLKERMAALKGSAAFGGGGGGAGAAPPPRPTGEKPKWKPPPVVQRAEPIGGEDEGEGAKAVVSPVVTTDGGEGVERVRSPLAEEDTKGDGGEGEAKEEGEPDPEEEERQRRAALAARMAKLGGARVGMGPPIFGKKPDIPPKRLSKSEVKPKEEEKPAEEAPKEEKPAEISPSAEGGHEGPTVEEAAAVALPPSAAESKAESSTEYIPERKDSASAPSSLLSPESSGAPIPVRSPRMPVPQAPKRAAPPRKRVAKSPSPAPHVLDQEIHESPSLVVGKDEVEKHEGAIVPEERGDRQPEVTEGQIEDIVKEVVPQAFESSKEESVQEPAAAPEPAFESPEEEHIVERPVPVVVEEPTAEVHAPIPAAEEQQPEEHTPAEPETHAKETLEVEPEPEQSEPASAHAPESAARAEEPEEEDEAARRKRIAERLAKSGGFNPFAGGMPPPVRRESSESARSPPPPLRRDSQPEAISPKLSLPERKASVGSVESGTARKSSFDVGAPTSEGQRTSEPSAPVLGPAPPVRELYEAPIEEVYEDEEAEPRAAERGSFDDDRASFVNEREHEKYEDTDERGVADEHEVVEEPENYEEEPGEPVVPPPPPRATRPPPTIPQFQSQEDEEIKSRPPPPRRDFAPPPPRHVSVPPPRPPPVAEEFEEEHEPEHDNEDEAHARHTREVGTEHQAEAHVHRYGEHDEPDEDEYEHHVQEEPAPPQPPRPTAVPPPPPPQTYEEDEEEEPAPPPPPRRIPSRGSSEHALLPPAVPRPHPPVETEEPEEFEEDEEPAPPPPPPRSARPASQVVTSPSISALSRAIPPLLRREPTPEPEQEVLDEADGDPIDPVFHSPGRSPSSSVHATSPQSAAFPLSSPVSAPPPPPPQRVVSPPPPQRVVSPPPPQRVVSPPPPPPQRIVSPPPAPERVASPPTVATSPTAEPQEEKTWNGEDTEQARRRTIAERMAKLGGIRFGAPPPIPAVRRPPPAEPDAEHEEAEEKPPEPEEAPQEEEEDEFTRKQRIAARIAGMGGMRFGMLPGAAPPKPPPRVQRDEEEEESVKSPPPPKRSAPVPPPTPPAADEDRGSESDYQHISDSDRIEHEESELEEVTHEDAKEEAPPPIPDRHARRVSSGAPPVPPSFASAPPVPRTRPPAPPAFTYPPPPPAPHPPPTTTETQGDFVVVDQPESDEPAPPPPPRGGRGPGRAPPAASGPEAPTIPNVDFGGETDLSLSGQWSEDSTNYPPAPPSTSVAHAERAQPAAPSRPPPAEQNFTADELQAQWGRVGVQVAEIAAAFFEKSKKSLVGDGSYVGFVNAVVGQVPNAAQPTGSLDSFGYPIYSQAAGAVQRRVSDIMPGDVIVVNDAKFKGHKGLQSYSQNVGVGEPLVGVIGDYEPKKSKVKVYQANQHVGQQSVESVSYRLEDLKSGAVKIYRVLEA